MNREGGGEIAVETQGVCCAGVARCFLNTEVSKLTTGN